MGHPSQLSSGVIESLQLVLHVRDYTMGGMGKDTVPGCGGVPTGVVGRGISNKKHPKAAENSTKS